MSSSRATTPGLTLRLSPLGGLVAETPHGLQVALPHDLAKVGPELLRLLQKQATPKTLTPGLTTETFHLILADWERIGPEGAGKVPKVRPPRDGRVRHFTQSGRELTPL